MPDYALINQRVHEGKAKEVEQMTRDALAEGRSAQETRVPSASLVFIGLMKASV